MSSVDKRVVVLEFNNSNFEKNVKQSTDTLNKLKKDLDFDASFSGLERLSSSIKKISFANISDGVMMVKDKFSLLETFGKRVVENIADSAVGMFKNIVTAIPNQIKSGGMSRALNMEQAQFMMSGLIDDAKQIDAIMASVTESVQGTAYGSDQAARVAAQLVASGKTDAAEMLEILKGIAGAASMTGSNYDEIGQIFTKIAGNGRVMSEELQQFSSRGLNVAATLGKQLNLTEAEVRDMASKGKIDFNMFSKAMSEAFGEQATKANETFNGSLANMKAALSRIGQTVAGPGLKDMTKIFNSLRVLINNIHEAIKPMLLLLNDKLAAATDKVVGIIDKIAEKVKGFTEGITTSGEKVENIVKKGFTYADEFEEKMAKVSKALGRDTHQMTETAEETATSMTASAEEIDQAVQDVLAGKYGNGEERRAAIEALGLSYEEVQNKVNEALGCEYRYEVATKETTEEIKKQSEETEKLSQKTNSINTIFSNLRTVLENVYFIFRDTQHAAERAFKDIFINPGDIDIINTIKVLSERLKELSWAFVTNDQSQEGLTTVFRILFRVIKIGLVIVGVAVDRFIELGIIIGHIRNGILEFIAGFDKANDAFDETSRKAKLVEAIAHVIDQLVESFKTFRAQLKYALDMAAKSHGFQHLQQTVERLWKVIKEFAGKVFDKFVDKLNKFNGIRFHPFWMFKFAEIVDKASEAVATFVDQLLNGEGPVYDFIHTVSDLTKNGFSRIGNIASTLKEAIKQQFADFDLSDVVETIKSAFQNSGISGLASAVKDLIFGGKKEKPDDGTSPFAAIKEWLSNAFKDVKAFLKDSNWAEIIDKILEKVLLIAKIFKTIEAAKLFKSSNKFVKKATGAVGQLKGAFKSVKNFFNTKTYDSIANIFKNIGVLIDSIGTTLFLISRIKNPDDAVRTLLTVIIGIGAVIGVIAALPIVDKDKIKGFGEAVRNLGIGVALLIPAILILGYVPWQRLVQGVIFLGIIVTELGVAARLAGSVKAAAAFLGLAVAVDLLVPALLILSFLPFKLALNAIKIIGLVVLELALAARLAGRSLKGGLAFVGMALAVDLLVPAIVALSLVPYKLAKKAIKEIAFILGMFVIASRTAGSIGSAAVFLIMALAIDLLIPALLILGLAPWSIIKKGMGSLALIIGMLALLALSTKASDFASLVTLAAILVVVVGSLYLLATQHDYNQILAAAVSIGLVIAALSLAAMASQNMNTKGIIALSLMIVPLLATVGGLAILAKYPYENIIAAAAAIGIVFLTLSASLLILQHVDFGGALQAIGILTILFAALATVVAVMGALFGEGGTFEGLMDKAVPVMESFGKALGSFVGGIIEGINEGISNSIERLGEALGNFGTSIQPFIDVLKQVDSSVLDGALNLSAACLALIGTEFLDNIASLFNLGESPLVSFGKELVSFGEYLAKYSDEVKGIGEDSVSGSAAAAEMLADMYKAVKDSGVKDGILGFLEGSPLQKFGEELAAFGPSMKSYADSVNGVSENSVSASAAAAGMLADMYTAVKESGVKDGILGFLEGNPLKKFGEELSNFGPYIKQYADSVSGMDSNATSASANAATILINMWKAATEAGIKDGLFSNEPLKKFGVELSKFGPELKKYADSVMGIDSTAVEASANAGKMLVDMYKTASDAGITDGLLSSNPLAGLADKIKEYGTKLTEYGPIAASVNAYSSYFDAVSDITSDIIEMAKSINVNTTFFKSMTTCAESIVDYGGKLKDYYDKIKSISTSTVSNVIKTTYDLIEVGKAMAYVNTTTMANFGKALENVGYMGVNAFIRSFTSSYSQARSAANGLIQASISGGYAAGGYTGWWNVGISCINGFINALASGYYAVQITAMNVGATAANGLRAALGVHSPSRVFYEVGDYSIQGFVNAFNDGARDVFGAGEEVGNVALKALTRPVQLIQQMLDTDLDLTPTITPVLDLTDLANGANVANGMLGGISGQIFANSLNVGGINTGETESGYQARQLDRMLDILSRMSEDDNINPINNTFNIYGDNPQEIAEEVSRIIQRQVERREASWA